jgi:hypothetical protein
VKDKRAEKEARREQAWSGGEMYAEEVTITRCQTWRTVSRRYLLLLLAARGASLR